ncbi:hypothetical protein BG004_008451 [Podila humilis]|nr:hypothetical protein BG004_008451 [Podila humilis]
MRVPCIILLSSAALAVLVHAEAAVSADNGAAVLTPPTVAAVIKDSNGPATVADGTTVSELNKKVDTVKDTTEEKKDTEQHNNINNNSDTNGEGVKTGIEGTDESAAAAARPVGKGIVVTTTSFSKSKKGGFIANLLGIDLDVEIGGDSKKKKKKKKNNVSDEGDLPKNIPLYGDDGYVPRPLPKQSCPTLGFLDQLVWDMQGTRTVHKNDKNDPTKMLAVQQQQQQQQPQQQHLAPAAGVDRMEHSDHSDPALAPATNNMAMITTDSNNKIVKDESSSSVDSEGIRICLLGICIGGPPDDDNDDDDDDDDHDHHHGSKKHISHRQKKFLRAVAKRKPLDTDSKTGCPIPTTDGAAPAQEPALSPVEAAST